MNTVGIWTVKAGMVDRIFGEIVGVQRVRPDATRITYASGYRRTVALGGRIHVEPVNA
jgi:hypothetical protein